jgi:hypothetical protein
MATAYGVDDESLRGARVGEGVGAEQGLFWCGLEISAADATYTLRYSAWPPTMSVEVLLFDLGAGRRVKI